MKKIMFGFLIIMVFTFFIECERNETTVTEEFETVSGADLDFSASDPFTALNCPECASCVKFVRCKMQQNKKILPDKDLSYYTTKKSIINSYIPEVGSAVIMDGSDSRYGHIAYVEEVFYNNSKTPVKIRFSDGGSYRKTCKYDNYTKLPNSKIKGYYKP